MGFGHSGPCATGCDCDTARMLRYPTTATAPTPVPAPVEPERRDAHEHCFRHGETPPTSSASPYSHSGFCCKCGVMEGYVVTGGHVVRPDAQGATPIVEPCRCVGVNPYTPMVQHDPPDLHERLAAAERRAEGNRQSAQYWFEKSDRIEKTAEAVLEEFAAGPEMLLRKDSRVRALLDALRAELGKK